MTLVLTIFLVVAMLALALALAYLPMRLLLGQMARHVSQFMRQRERRQEGRETPDRRKAPQA